MEKVMIIGASGHAKVIADVIIRSGDQLVGFLDDNTDLPDTIVGYPYLGTISEYRKYTADCSFVIGIGNNHIRRKIAESMDVHWYTAIHPSALLAIDTEIGEGSVIMANAVINTSARIGKHCIINTGAVIEHDNEIGDYVHVSPSATLCGTVSVGEMTHIGAGATVKNNLAICGHTIIGAGGVVVRSIDTEGVYVGVPVHRLDVK
jgi:sugar O-acyltransferase (sialic acid O-acetyltransferase NeuD family)